MGFVSSILEPDFNRRRRPMRVELKLTSILGIAVLCSAVWGSGQLNAVGETRGSHGHDTLEWQTASQQPPLLDYIPTYHQHVRPILERSCAGCHSAGNIAPFTLDTPEAAVEHARGIQRAVQSRYMPPVRAGGSTPPLLHDTRLTDEEIAIVANWSWAGAPLGKKTDAPPATSDDAPRKRMPDIVISSPRAFQPDSTLTDEYRCFVIDPNLTKPTFLDAYSIIPGNKRMVHHVLLFQVAQKSADIARGYERANTDGRPGYPCFGGTGIGSSQSSTLGVWAPGVTRVDYPDGTGTKLEAGDVLIMQIHYNLLAARGEDQSTAELYFANGEVTPLVATGLIAPVEIPCPGPYPSDPTHPCHREAAYKRAADLKDTGAVALKNPIVLSFCKRQLSEFTSGSSGENIVATCEFPLQFTDPKPVGVYGALGHMHLLGSSFKLEVIRGGTSQTVLEIPKWDFHWQSSYWLKTPMRLNTGDVVRITCTYDNRAQNQPEVNGRRVAPRYVVWGEGTLDEMCLSFAQLGPI
jgi:hypothetical protein